MTAVGRLPGADDDVRVRTTSPWQATGARAWYLAAVSLVLAGNAVVSSRLFSDSFYDLYDGRYILAHGIPHANVATAASYRAPWIDQQWLAHVVYYGAWVAGGYPALAMVSAVLVTGGFAVTGLLMLGRGVAPHRMFAWLLAGFAVCLGNTVVRAQSFGYLFFALTVWLVVTDDAAPRLRKRTWLVIPVLIAWANTHGSVLLGAGLVVLYAAYRAVRSLTGGDPRGVPGYLVLAAGAVAAIACTPFGVAVAGYYRPLIGNPVLSRYVMEWARPSLYYPLSWAFFAMLAMMLGSMSFAWRRGARPDPLLVILTLALLGAALIAVRNQAWFGLGGGLLAADTLARAGAGRAAAFGPKFRRAVAAVLATFAAVATVSVAVTPARVFESGVPVRALDVATSIAARNPALRVIGDDWSDTAMLWLHPAMLGRVGFDIREELYGRAELTAYFEFVLMRGPRWERAADGYGIIVVSRLKYPGLGAALARSPRWRVAYADRDGFVFVRRNRH